MKSKTRKLFAKYGVDVTKAIRTVMNLPISLHCWQLDDVTGFESKESLSGGIQVTGNYPGKARNFDELTADFDEVLKYIPGKKKINLHAIYGVSKNGYQRDQLTPALFAPWVDYAKKRNIGLDFNPTLFSSPWVKDNLTLSSPDSAVRDYWIRHCKQSREIAEYFGRELDQKSLCNIWIPDGFKDDPVDRFGPRLRLKEALDDIYSVKLNRHYIADSVESKVFGIGVESYTTGSHEFYMNYANSQKIMCLLDMGHFHPTENVADKLSSLLVFQKQLALHVSRPVRWDSDHVLKLNDDLQAIANEIIKHTLQGKEILIGLDYFDASINRVAAMIVGARNMQKALLIAALMPWDQLKAYQDAGDFTRLLALQEELKMLPLNEVWEFYCEKENVPSSIEWLDAVKAYEEKIMKVRGL